MFVSEQLVFVHLQKTAGVHIAQLLSRLLPGSRQQGHLQVPAEYHARFVIGSIRNPWAWYVSLWAYGCGGKGSVHANVTRPLNHHQLDKLIPQDMGVAKLSAWQQLRYRVADRYKPTAAWNECYQNHADAAQFRRWLKMLLSDQRRWDVQEGYALSPLARSFGLLTYRHFHLQTTLGTAIYQDRSLSNLAGLQQAWTDYPLLKATIRNEHLEADLMAALQQAGVHLSAANIEMIEKAGANPKNSSRRLATADYYDASTRELVARKEAFIIEQYGYKFPTD